MTQNIFVRAALLCLMLSGIPAALYLSADLNFFAGYATAFVAGFAGLGISLVIRFLSEHHPLSWWVNPHRTYLVSGKKVYAFTPWIPEVFLGVLSGVLVVISTILTSTLDSSVIPLATLFALEVGFGAWLVWLCFAAILSDDGLYLGTAIGVFASLLLFPWNTTMSLLADRSALVWDRFTVIVIIVVTFLAFAWLLRKILRGGRKPQDSPLLMDREAAERYSRARR